MKTINIDELKQLQISLLDELKIYCEENNLTYFLAYGTLIGAIRHHGYIPWDDDVDVIMPRDDYDYLINNFNNDVSESFSVVDYKIDKNYYLPFAKLVRTDTVLKEEIDSPFEIGVYLDVFPLDNMGSSKAEARINLAIAYFLNALQTFMNVPIKKDRAFYKNAILLFGKIFTSTISNVTVSKWIELFSKFKRGNRYVGVMAGVLKNNDSRIFDPKWFENSTSVTFENKQYAAPNGYDKLLNTVYGNYMKLPPEKDRVPHHSFEAWYK